MDSILEARLTPNEKKIAVEIIKEIRVRLEFLLNVGLDYLQLNRSSKSLSKAKPSVSVLLLKLVLS